MPENNTGMPRCTVGNLHLMDVVDFLVAIVGLFAVSEIFVFIETHGKDSLIGVTLGRVVIPSRDLRRSFRTMIRASVASLVCGVLPGAGASLGSFME